MAFNWFYLKIFCGNGGLVLKEMLKHESAFEQEKNLKLLKHFTIKQ
jgi:hypothetical protein